mgnify:CR=1 FL=1
MFRTIKSLAVSFALVVSTLGFAAHAHATTTISKSQREALVFIANLSQGSPAQQAFYDFVEFSAQGSLRST